MRKFPSAFLVPACLLLVTPSLYAMGGTYGKGDPKSPISSSGWSAELTLLINRSDRIGGSWVNELSAFEYAGDAAAFNEFLAAYAKLTENPHALFLRADEAPAPDPSTPRGDWYLSINTNWNKAPTNAGLTLIIGGKLKLADVILPPGVTVSCFGEPSAEARAFFDRYPFAVRASTTRPATANSD